MIKPKIQRYLSQERPGILNMSKNKNIEIKDIANGRIKRRESKIQK